MSKLKAKAGSDEGRRAARTLVQGVWATLASVGLVGATEAPVEVLVLAVPVAAGLLSWAANEWEDSEHKPLRFISRVISLVKKEVKEVY